MTNSHKNIINPFLESSTLLIMTFPEIVESKDLLWGRTCAVDNVRARRKGVLGKLYEIQISPERGLRNSLKFPSYFGMEYVRPWNMGKKLLEVLSVLSLNHPTKKPQGLSDNQLDFGRISLDLRIEILGVVGSLCGDSTLSHWAPWKSGTGLVKLIFIDHFLSFP